MGETRSLVDMNFFLLCNGSYACVCVSPQPSQKTRDPSVRVHNDWEVVHEIEFSQLSKLNFMPGTPKEL